MRYFVFSMAMLCALGCNGEPRDTRVVTELREVSRTEIRYPTGNVGGWEITRAGYKLVFQVAGVYGDVVRPDIPLEVAVVNLFDNATSCEGQRFGEGCWGVWDPSDGCTDRWSCGSLSSIPDHPRGGKGIINGLRAPQDGSDMAFRVNTDNQGRFEIQIEWQREPPERIAGWRDSLDVAILFRVRGRTTVLETCQFRGRWNGVAAGGFHSCGQAAWSLVRRAVWPPWPNDPTWFSPPGGSSPEGQMQARGAQGGCVSYWPPVLVDTDDDGYPDWLDDCIGIPRSETQGCGCDYVDSGGGGVNDCNDPCPFNPFVLGLWYDDGGPCGWGDFDGDGDVDMDDFALLQRCYTGDFLTVTRECEPFDIDGDDRVNDVELGYFRLCASGPSVPVHPECLIGGSWSWSPPEPPDGDGDGVPDAEDNCPTVFNPRVEYQPGDSDVPYHSSGSNCISSSS